MPQHILSACVCGYVGFLKPSRTQYDTNKQTALIGKPDGVGLLNHGMLQAGRYNQPNPLKLSPSEISKGEFTSPPNNICISSVHGQRNAAEVLKGYQISAILFEKKIQEWTNKLIPLNKQVIHCFTLDIVLQDSIADRLIDNELTADIQAFQKQLVKYKFLVDTDAPIVWNMTPSLRGDVSELIRTAFIILEKTVHTLDSQLEKLKLVVDDTIQKTEARKRAERNKADLESSLAHAASLRQEVETAALTAVQPTTGPAASRVANAARATAFRDAVHRAAAPATASPRDTAPVVPQVHRTSPPINVTAPAFVTSVIAYPAPVYNPRYENGLFAPYEQITPTLLHAGHTPVDTVSTQRTPSETATLIQQTTNDETENDFLSSSFDDLEHEIAENMLAYHNHGSA